MRRALSIVLMVLVSFVLSNCGTIIGGMKYHAKVQVDNHPEAQIKYMGKPRGIGEANFKAKRKEADNFTVKIKKKGCSEQTRRFTSRDFRGWAFAGTLLGWTGFISGIPLPFGVATDLITGALWKPDIEEKGVVKQDFNHFVYKVNYSGCEDKNVDAASTSSD